MRSWRRRSKVLVPAPVLVRRGGHRELQGEVVDQGANQTAGGHRGTVRTTIPLTSRPPRRSSHARHLLFRVRDILYLPRFVDIVYRRLEQNQITEILPKAFVKYKRLRRMWVHFTTLFQIILSSLVGLFLDRCHKTFNVRIPIHAGRHTMQ